MMCPASIVPAELVVGFFHGETTLTVRVSSQR
jgi:hypothetical protein